jgi:tRNA (guanine37-N1)-methyltransferase
MKIDILTLFPEMFLPLNTSIIGRAQENNLLRINLINYRDYSTDRLKHVDDTPYGGGAGMVIKPEPIYDAYKDIVSKSDTKSQKVIYMSPKGKLFNQQMAKELSKEEHLIILCGHYEGVDERIIEEIVDEEISIGDYVLTGGELPAMCLVDAVARNIDGVLSDDSTIDESFSNGLLEYPQYTRPEEFMGRKVPEVLLSGHHANIKKWREEESYKRTLKKRPELLNKRGEN